MLLSNVCLKHFFIYYTYRDK